MVDAKRERMPTILVDRLYTGDERAIPHLGNVPVVRMDPVAKDRLPKITGELGRCTPDPRRCRWGEASPERWLDTHFAALPAELVSTATPSVKQGIRRIVVYPDPPFDSAELRLLVATWSALRIRLLSLSSSNRIGHSTSPYP